MTPAEHAAALRAIDANFNRAVEGLRVVEDHARFGLSSAHLAQACKELRHALTVEIAELDPVDERIIARDTLADVGTSISVPTEGERPSLRHLVAANFQRVAQAIRTIEEFAKLIGASAMAFELLRYRSYTLAKAFQTSERSCAVWDGRQLYVLIDGRGGKEEFADLAGRLITAGVHVIQLRDKRLADRELFGRGWILRRLIDAQMAGERKPLFIMNDRPDLAMLTRADGVHVGQEELPVSEVRRLVGTAMQIGVSTHNIAQARAAVLAGADYLGCGPTFPSGTKAFDAFPGTAFLQEVAAEISLPAFAIGGITLDNLSQARAAGFSRIAVSGAITGQKNPAAVVADLLRVLDSTN